MLIDGDLLVKCAIRCAGLVKFGVFLGGFELFFVEKFGNLSELVRFGWIFCVFWGF